MPCHWTLHLPPVCEYRIFSPGPCMTGSRNVWMIWVGWWDQPPDDGVNRHIIHFRNFRHYCTCIQKNLQEKFNNFCTLYRRNLLTDSKRSTVIQSQDQVHCSFWIVVLNALTHNQKCSAEMLCTVQLRKRQHFGWFLKILWFWIFQR